MVAGGDLVHRLDDLRRRGVLEQEAAGPVAQCPHHVVVGVERRQHDHLGRRRPAPSAGRVPRGRPSGASGCPSSTTSGATRAMSSSPVCAVVGLADQLDRRRRRAGSSQSAARTSASSSTITTRMRRRRLVHCRPRQPGSDDEVSVGCLVLEAPPDQLGSLGRARSAPDPSRASRSRPAPTRIGLRTSRPQPTARATAERDVDGGVRRVLARVRQALLDHPVGAAPDRVGCLRQVARCRCAAATRVPAPAASWTRRRQVDQRRLGRLRGGVRVDGAQYPEDRRAGPPVRCGRSCG